MFEWKKWDGEDVHDISFVCIVATIDEVKNYAFVPQAFCTQGVWSVCNANRAASTPFCCIDVTPKSEIDNDWITPLYDNQRGDEIYYCSPVCNLPNGKVRPLQDILGIKRASPSFIAFEDSEGFEFR